ncbi:MAG: YncE family protein, partial [Candidatus Aminicenantales bacterium]
MRRPVFSAALAFFVLWGAASCRKPAPPDTTTVGPPGPDRTVVPTNQVVRPAGKQIPLPGLRPQALALSPDGRLLAVSGKTSELVILDAASGEIRERVELPSEGLRETLPQIPSPNLLEPDVKGQLSYTGLVFSPDGRHLYLSNVNGSIKAFSVGRDGGVRPSHSISLPAANVPRREEEIPAGLAVSPDGRKLYVCGNLSNRLLEIDPETGLVFRTIDVGVAPYDIVLAGGKAYVSNWG